MRQFVLPITFFLLFFTILPIEGQVRPPVKIGIISDNEEAPLDLIKEEFDALLEARYQIIWNDNYIKDCNYVPSRGVDLLQSFLGDTDVDIIVIWGNVMAQAVATQRIFSKPVICWGIFDPIQQGLSKTYPEVSGVPNLAFFYVPEYLEKSTRSLQQIVPFDKVGLLLNEDVFPVFPKDVFKKLFAPSGLEIYFFSANQEGNLTIPEEEVDVVFLGPTPMLPIESRKKILQYLQKKKIPSFVKGEDNLLLGALAGYYSVQEKHKVVRRMALTLEAILDGREAAEMPTTINLDEKLHLNLETARRLDLTLTFEVLSKSTLHEKEERNPDRVLDLRTIMKEALVNNLNYQVELLKLSAQKYNINLARTDWFPSLSIGATGATIDKDRAAAAGGIAPQHTGHFTAQASQLIYSEDVLTNIKVNKHLFQSSAFLTERAKLDVLLGAGTAYLRVLINRANYQIQVNNLELTQRNLEIARLREQVGYSGRSEVLRWESTEAEATSAVIQAETDYQISRRELNKLLNRPLEEVFELVEVTTDDPLFIDPENNYIKEQLLSPKGVKTIYNYFLEVALKRAPELNSLRYSLMAQERLLKGQQKGRFLPTIALQAEGQSLFFRDGEGSSTVEGAPDDQEWSVGVNATLPLLEGGARNARVKQLRQEIFSLKEEETLVIRDIELQLNSNLRQSARSSIDLTLTQKAAKAASESFELVQDSYSKGEVSIVELIDAQNNYLRSDLSAANARYRHLQNMLQLQRTLAFFLPMIEKEELIKLRQDYFEFMESKNK